MSDRRFRFGLVAGRMQDMNQWTGLARWAEDAGYDVMLSPDAIGTCSPFVSLAAAAAVTTRLRLGTFVLVVPLRATGPIARETASLDRASGGRFELGLGAGRPDAKQEAELFGLPWGSAHRRVEQVGEAITGLRSIFAHATAADSDTGGGRFGGGGFLRPEQQPHPPIMVAASGPSLLRLAAQEADTITFGLQGNAGEDVLAEKIDLVREHAGGRFDDIELSLNIWAAGDSTMPQRMAVASGLDIDSAIDNKVLAVLNGSPSEIADVLVRRRDQFGVSYITVNSLAMKAFAPVIELLAGR
jgi:probable F420-dependent oxidoreductase